MKKSLKFLLVAFVVTLVGLSACQMMGFVERSYKRVRNTLVGVGAILTLMIVFPMQIYAQDQAYTPKNGVERKSHTITDFRTTVSTTLTSLHGAFIPLQVNNLIGSKVIPEYRLTFMGMRFSSTGRLAHSAGLEVAFSLLPVGVNGKAGTLSAGIGWISDNQSRDRWRYSSTSAFGYMGAYHHQIQEGDKSANISSHGLYFNKGFSLLRQLGSNYSVGMNVGVNFFYLWDWKMNTSINLPYGKRAGFGLYPTLGVVFNYSNF